MASIFENTYSSRANANRGAKRAALTPGTFEVREGDGSFYIVALQADDEQTRADAEYAARKKLFEDQQQARADEEARLIAEANAKPARKVKEKATPAPETKRDDLKLADTGDAKSKSYKEVANYEKSSVDKPVNFVHSFLDANPGLTRKEAVVTLTDKYGVNYSTARTQYQRWFSARGSKKGA